jgi:1,4-alpha-glucan branching enzyme
MTYAFTENFMLPLSHDEVVYGKKSILGKMPGDEWQRFANLRLLYSYMFTHPGTNLLFQGSEFGQSSEWNFEGSLDWYLLQYEPHKGVKELVKALNTLYKKEPALYEKQFSAEGFEWIDYGDSKNSVFTYIRKGNDEKDDMIVACNMSPVPKEKYKLGLPRKGKLVEIFNSDLKKYYGSDLYKNKMKTTKAEAWHFRDHSVDIDIPPLGMVAFKYENENELKAKTKLETKSKVKSIPKSKTAKEAKPKSK